MDVALTEGTLTEDAIVTISFTGGTPAAQMVTLNSGTTSGTLDFDDLASDEHELTASTPISANIVYDSGIRTVTVLPKVELSLMSDGAGSLVVTATITDGTLVSAVSIAPVLSGPSSPTINPLMVMGSSGEGTAEDSQSFASGELSPGDWSLGAITPPPAGIILNIITTSSVTVDAPTLTLIVSSSVPFSTNRTIMVTASDLPFTGGGPVTVTITATPSSGSPVTATATLNSISFANVETSAFSGLLPENYTLTASASPAGTLDTSAISQALEVTPLTVMLSRAPAGDFVTTDNLMVMVQVTDPLAYSGTAELTLSGIGASRTVILSDNIITTEDYGMLSAGSYTLTAAGDGIELISDIPFNVTSP